jgi:CRISPR-associated protein (TIGR02584 family)
MNDPVGYPRRVLLAVTGLSPQVVTESLYALTRVGDPPFVPTEVQIITTRQGAEHARLNLLSADPGWFHRLRRDYALPEIAFDADRIQVLRGAGGAPLEDIRTPAENELAADLLVERVRALTDDPDCALHVSIAGGRKTMGFYLGYALSLFGRPQDRLSHVLVSAPFESHPQFYYPTPYERVIHTLDRAQTPLDCREAQVTLAEIPFVRLRDGLPTRLLKGRSSFTATVEAARRALEPAELTLDLPGRRVRAGGEVIEMTPSDLAFYSVAARRRKAGDHPLKRGDPDLAGPYLAELKRVAGEMAGELERAEQALAKGMDQDYFDHRKSRTNAALDEALGPQLARPYRIQSSGRGTGRFGLLNIDPEAIRYADLAGPAANAPGDPPEGREVYDERHSVFFETPSRSHGNE